MIPLICPECRNIEFRFFTEYDGRKIYECTSCGYLVLVEAGKLNEKQAIGGMTLQMA